MRRENWIYVGLWILVVFLYVLHIMGRHPAGNDALISSHEFTSMIISLIPYLIIFLINNYLLIPRLLVRRHNVSLYVLSVIAIIALTAVWQYHEYTVGFERMIEELGLGEERHHRPGPPPNRLLPMPFIHDVIYSILVVGANLAISMTARQVVYNLQQEKLSTATVESQLDQLRSQISPHFYMNMLNNIHGLIETDPEKAQDLVFDLSQLMRYMLYESTRHYLPLQREVRFMEDYVRLMRNRYRADKLTVTMDLPSDAATRDIAVAPLIFICFVENAFKHGVSYRHHSQIDISLHVTAEEIVFHCVNTLHSEDKQDHETLNRREQGHHGIGLRNVSRRLEMIYGPQYLPVINTTDTHYSVSLHIPKNKLHEIKNTAD